MRARARARARARVKFTINNRKSANRTCVRKRTQYCRNVIDAARLFCYVLQLFFLAVRKKNYAREPGKEREREDKIRHAYMGLVITTNVAIAIVVAFNLFFTHF